MLSQKLCKLCALNLVSLALIVGLASFSRADVVREQSSRVEYADAVDHEPLDKFSNSRSADQQDSQKETPVETDALATRPSCTCQDNGETKTNKVSDEIVSKSKASAKKIAKKYKVITISMPEDDQTDADAVIETKVEEQAEPQVAPMKDDGEVTEQAEPETEEAESELQQEEKPRKSKSGKAIKGNKKTETKRSKREAGQKRSKRDNKETKRPSSKDNYKKSKRGGDSNKGKKGKK